MMLVSHPDAQDETIDDYEALIPKGLDIHYPSLTTLFVQSSKKETPIASTFSPHLNISSNSVSTVH